MSLEERIAIRPAEDKDVSAVKDLFVKAYGCSYPFKEFYDTSWLKKSVFDDDTLFLIAESAGRILGTVSTMFTAGGLSDLIGEFGRLVVHPEARGRDLGTRLFEAAMSRAGETIRFGFAEARTEHPASQKILERLGFTPLGFEPLKYRLEDRESVVMYGKLFGSLSDLRRNHPRVIPEVASLAAAALEGMGIPPDIVVVDDRNGYPTAGDATWQQTGEVVRIEDLSERGWSPLLRIERGRVTGREVFGNLSLAHGFFKIKTRDTRYLVAKRDTVVVGGLGFTSDAVDEKVRIFELIGFDDAVKGQLLGEVERIARDEFKAAYIEIDVNAYVPAIQRTLERMGYLAVAYCPSMVFENVERLDVIRMAKLFLPYVHEDIPLTAAAGRVRNLIEQSLADRSSGAAVASAARSTNLFSGIDEGDIYHLGRIGRFRKLAAGERLISRGDSGDNLYIVVSGAMKVVIEGRELSDIGPGETAGEMSLLDAAPRSADVIIGKESTVVEIRRDDIVRLMEERPRLGATLMRNLAISLAEKLRRTSG